MAFSTVTSLALVLIDLESSRWFLRAILLAWGWSLALSLVPLQTAAFATMRAVDMGRRGQALAASGQGAVARHLAIIAERLVAVDDGARGAARARGG